MKSAWTWIVLGIAGLFYLSLFPFTFDWTRRIPQVRFDWPRTDGDWVDSILNVLVYLPFGMVAQRRLPLYGVILLASGVSASIEFLQIYLPFRHPSMRDLLLNVTGAGMGQQIGEWLQRVPQTTVARVRGAMPMFEGRLAMFYWGLWFTWQAAPFLPSFRRHHLFVLQQSVQTLAISMEKVVDQACMVALLALLAGGKARKVAGWMSIGIIGGSLVYTSWWDYSDWLGLGLGLLWARLGLPFIAVPWLGWLVWKQFHGIGAQAPPAFGWLPFGGFAQMPFPVLKNVANKAFLYSGPVWLLAQMRVGGQAVVFVIAGVVAIGEWAQRSIPGRTPEITDPIVALVAGLLVLRWRGQKKD